MNKTTVLSILVCINLILVATTLVIGTTPRTAVAQGTGLHGNYMVVSGEIQDEFDALYLLDLKERTLHTFYFIKGGNELQYAGYRSLERDFRHNQ